jgi:hypothetical protein
VNNKKTPDRHPEVFPAGISFGEEKAMLRSKVLESWRFEFDVKYIEEFEAN